MKGGYFSIILLLMSLHQVLSCHYDDINIELEWDKENATRAPYITAGPEKPSPRRKREATVNSSSDSIKQDTINSSSNSLYRRRRSNADKGEWTWTGQRKTDDDPRCAMPDVYLFSRQSERLYEVSDADLCQRLCRQEKMVFWTFFETGKICSLTKGETEVHVRQHQGAISGPRSCYGCMMKSTLYSSSSSWTVEMKNSADCHGRCHREPKCRFWSFDAFNEVCHLHGDVIGVVSDGEFTSGKKLCGWKH